MFVAATMPSEGKKSTAADLRQICPDALWLNGGGLHQAQLRIQHSWHPITQLTWRQTLQVGPPDPETRLWGSGFAHFVGIKFQAEDWEGEGIETFRISIPQGSDTGCTP